MSSSTRRIAGRIARVFRSSNDLAASNTVRTFAPRLQVLEDRRLLVGATSALAIEGRVFIDDDSNGAYTAGEEIENAMIRLYRDDDQNGTFAPGTDFQVGIPVMTDSNGEYCFDNLDPSFQYFVFQEAQTVNGVSLSANVSAAIDPGSADLLIDDFDDPTASVGADREVVANVEQPLNTRTTQLTDETHIIGQERDLLALLQTGNGEVELRVDRFGQDLLRYETTAGVEGQVEVIWDGIDSDGATTSLGLAGRDLTQGGTNFGIGMKLGIDLSGSGESLVLRLYQGSDTNFSEASALIPVTNGGEATEYLFIPFTDFVGNVSPTNVDAIQLVIGNGSRAIDGQMDFIGAVGPKSVNFLNASGADLQITKTNGSNLAVVPGSSTEYTVTVVNQGPNDVTGATVVDFFNPSLFGAVSYVSTANNGATGNTLSGTGNISDTVDMPVGSSFEYIITAEVLPSATGTLSNTATVTSPNGVSDPTPANNSATDSDRLEAHVDLVITKTDGVEVVVNGSEVTYTITVTNDGPSNVTGASFVDTFPRQLDNVSYTSEVISGTASGNTSSDPGDDPLGVADTLDMAVGSSIVYQVTGTMVAAPGTTVTNTAVVSVPAGVVEQDTSNNTARDIDTVSEFDLAISKFNNITPAVPGEFVEYEIIVSNNSSIAANGVTIADQFPAALDPASISYTSSVITGTVTGNTASGTSNILDTVDMSTNSSLMYVVSARILPETTGTITNVATVTAADGANEAVTSNNTATRNDLLQPEVDLQISKIDDADSIARGGVVNYTITVDNSGPSDAFNATVVDDFSSVFSSVSYTSTATGGATGNTSGTGDINDLVNIPAGGQIVYEVAATVATDATPGEITNAATVTPEDGITETTQVNNNDTAPVTILEDPVDPDLAITKSNSLNEVVPGSQFSYEIIASNNGTIDVSNASVLDNVPAAFTNVVYSSVATGGASGNTPTGAGSINDTVELPVGGEIRYTVTGTVADDATGTLVNTATIATPDGVTDLNETNNSSTDSDPIRPIADLAITKVDNVDTVTAGDAVIYTITVSNVGAIDVFGATVTDTFSSDFSNVSYTSVASGGATGNTSAGGGNLTQTVSLPVGSSIVYTVTAQLLADPVGSTISNTATVAVPTNVTEINLTNNSATDSATIQDSLQVDLSITKDDGITTATAGSDINYSIVVSNIGQVDVTGATVSDTFSADFDSVSYTSVAAGGATGNTASSTGDLSETVNLPIGSSITYNVTARLSEDPSGTSISNTAVVAVPDGLTDINTANNSATDTDTVDPLDVDLSISKTDGVTNVTSGGTLTYVIIASNIGERNVTGATITDTFSADIANATFTSVASGGATGNTSGSGNLNETVNLPVGSSIEYTVQASVVDNPSSNSLSNTATIAAPAGLTDIELSNNTATDVDTIDAPNVDLSITKDNGVTNVNGGDSVTYTIVVSNVGDVAVTGATVQDTFNSDFQNVAFTSVASGGATGNTDGNGNLDETVNLPVGSSIIYTVTADIVDNTDDDLLRNTATVAVPAGLVDIQLDNNSAEDVDTVDAIEVDLSITKTDGLTTVTAGDELTYTITVANVGQNNVNGATVSDSFPVELINATFTSAALNGATLNEASGSGNINDTVNLPAGSSIVYTVNATVDPDTTSTELSNTAEVGVPAGTLELDTTNNSATDVDTINAVDAVVAELSGFVYIDIDKDGNFDEGELPIPAVDIVLEQNGTELGRVQTGNDGAYAFRNLTPGTYTVREDQPNQFADGLETAAGGQGSVTDNDEFTVQLQAGDNATQLNFGENIIQPTKRSLLASSFAN